MFYNLWSLTPTATGVRAGCARNPEGTLGVRSHPCPHPLEGPWSDLRAGVREDRGVHTSHWPTFSPGCPDTDLLEGPVLFSGKLCEDWVTTLHNCRGAIHVAPCRDTVQGPPNGPRVKEPLALAVYSKQESSSESPMTGSYVGS